LALQHSQRRWSTSGAPALGGARAGADDPPQHSLYSGDALHSIHRRQSLALNHLQQQAISRTDSALGLPDLFSPTVQQQQQGLSIFASATPKGGCFDMGSLDSPYSPVRGEFAAVAAAVQQQQREHLASPHAMQQRQGHAGFGLPGPHTPSAAEADYAIWQLAGHVSSLQLQQQQQAGGQSPFTAADREPCQRAEDMAAASLLSSGQGMGLHHSESAPAGLFRQEDLHHLCQLADNMGLVLSSAPPHFIMLHGHHAMHSRAASQ
jgi:hypothetical protein